MNKLIAAIAAIALIFNLPIVANANNLNQPNVISNENTKTTYLDNGLIVRYEITEIPSNARANTRTAVKTANFETVDGKVITTVKLTASFSYNGSSATCTSANASYIMYDGWMYSNKNTTRSGNSATTTAKLSKGRDYFNVNVTMSCSPSGSIS